MFPVSRGKAVAMTFATGLSPYFIVYVLAMQSRLYLAIAERLIQDRLDEHAYFDDILALARRVHSWWIRTQ
jgi:hypothetical protein